MIGSEIITKFELYCDDSTELSSQEELDLANKVARGIYDMQPWEFLRKNSTGVIGATGITVPTDFMGLMVNCSDDNTSSLPDTVVVYVNSRPYKVIPMGNRGNYAETDICWYNPSNGLIEFKQNPTGAVYSFDYKYLPADITDATEPPIPTSHYLIVYGMLIDDEVIQKIDKAHSSLSENNAFFQKHLTDLKAYNSRLFFV